MANREPCIVGEALHPSTPKVSTQELIDGYRVQFGHVLAQTWFARKTNTKAKGQSKGKGKTGKGKKGDEGKLEPQVEAKLAKAVKRAQEVVIPGMVQDFMEAEGEEGEFGIEAMHKLDVEMNRNEL